MKFGRHSVSTCWNFRIPTAVQDLLLLTGGRYAVTVHRNRIQCGDLGFPRSSDKFGIDFVARSFRPRCVDEHILPSGEDNLGIVVDARSQSVWQGAGCVRVFACTQANPAWMYARRCPFCLRFAHAQFHPTATFSV